MTLQEKLKSYREMLDAGDITEQDFNSMKATAIAAESAPPVSTPTVQQVTIALPTQKESLIAYLLWFFLGGFGMHRFYLGHTGMGIFMIVCTVLSVVTMGITAIPVVIVLLYDLFAIPGMVRDCNTAANPTPQPVLPAPKKPAYTASETSNTKNSFNS